MVEVLGPNPKKTTHVFLKAMAIEPPTNV